MTEASRSFARAFASALGAGAGEDSSPQAAARYWMNVEPAALEFEVAPRRFAEFLAARVQSLAELGATEPHARELVLACGCLDGHARAIASLEEQYLRPLRGRPSGPGESIEDVVQLVSEKLLMGSRPKLATFTGRGELRRFIKAIAARTAIDRSRRRREEPEEDSFFDRLTTTGANPEVEALRTRYRAELKAALAQGLATLPDRDRLWLRQYYVDGIRLERIAAMHGVVASTVSRALERARVTLIQQVSAALESRGIPGPDVGSMLALVGSRLSLPDA